jgi:polar amino acid transport system permease protein
MTEPPSPSTAAVIDSARLTAKGPRVRWASLPWWAFILVAAALLVIYLILAAPKYRETFSYLSAGMLVTLRITVASYSIATVIGLFTGLARTSKSPFAYTISTLYVEAVRGIPLIVLMLYMAFVLVPMVMGGLRAIATWGLTLGPGGGLASFLTGMSQVTSRQISLETRAIIALGFGYGAYEAEIFRAGIQSIGRGQMEAARSLGMTYPQAMLRVILPQAIRRVLPPLGNDFIACLKDSSLATVLAVNELTQLGRIRRSSTFRVFETFNVLTFLYLSMTLALSGLVRVLERKMKFEE